MSWVILCEILKVNGRSSFLFLSSPVSYVAINLSRYSCFRLQCQMKKNPNICTDPNCTFISLPHLAVRKSRINSWHWFTPLRQIISKNGWYKLPIKNCINKTYSWSAVVQKTFRSTTYACPFYNHPSFQISIIAWVDLPGTRGAIPPPVAGRCNNWQTALKTLLNP